MIVVKIASSEPENAVARVKTLLEETAVYDPNWNGAEFKIERGAFTCIECADEVNGAVLLGAINRALRTASA
jgi:hypothetical protein